MIGNKIVGDVANYTNLFSNSPPRRSLSLGFGWLLSYRSTVMKEPIDRLLDQITQS